MAKVIALIAGKQYKFASEADEASMLAVIEEANRRIEAVRQNDFTTGEREQIMLALLDAVAELNHPNFDVEADRERISLEARLAYLESALDYNQKLSASLQKNEGSKRPKRSKRRANQKKIDFIDRQVELKI